MPIRIEKDALGEREINHKCYYGIHTTRAMENFSVSKRKVAIELIYGLVEIKKAAAMTHKANKNMESSKADAIIEACNAILEGKYDACFVTDALQGGAGTSTNMNVNEVIANIALEISDRERGDYAYIHPFNDVNRSQSTNDVYPTALRIASIRQLRKVSQAFADLQEAFQEKEKEFDHVIKLGRTQLMDALPIMLGQEFGAYAAAVARDRWRIYKVEERLRQTNLGGTAVGTGMNAEKKYIFKITDILRELTGIGLARAEFPIDITQNNDVFVEVSGLLKAAAVNLIKIANDLRLMNSGPCGGLGEISLPILQAGSSIMPGKVNPVIPEMVIQVCTKVIANDGAITACASYGQLELNAFMPLIADSLLESLDILYQAVTLFRKKCIEGIKANEEVCKAHLLSSTALATALITYIGYDLATDVAKEALQKQKTVKEIVLERKLMDEKKLDSVLNPYQVTKPGIPS